MSKSNPIFIPFSMLNNDNKCVTYNVQNFTGKVHMTLDGVLICSTDYDGLEEDLEEAFNAFGLGETNRQLIRGVVLESSPVTAVVNDEEAAVVAAATAAAAADGFDGNEELVAVSIKGMSIPYNRIHIPKMSFMARLRSVIFFSSGASQGYLQTHVTRHFSFNKRGKVGHLPLNNTI
ncbi:hypothetical protein FRACYDRAFT_243339 [Fragilariopsis cylindrus CCMP1102]|uniref:Uncharacterized protein n=1 Tax=Fragilariopsis cylindrus CCMP1102 TaxID=635003 RepID=A0A1E7F4B7_9STRA|nr:hypothetical protein FRACYDRAFT_243339 [Fragilariopsis cylindrus CCMP1102]|eukprot:OEU12987.1 hypothetical protein FRACYDRAFT_243339 [Fragilariopsis cylindrus CCMP1102]